MSIRNTPARWGHVAQFLHWLIVVLITIQVIDPEYMKPMFQGWGIAVLAATAASVAAGTAIIFRMIKIEV